MTYAYQFHTKREKLFIFYGTKRDTQIWNIKFHKLCLNNILIKTYDSPIQKEFL